VRLELQVLLHPPISQALAGLTRMDLTLSFPAVHEQVPIARVQHEGCGAWYATRRQFRRSSGGAKNDRRDEEELLV